MEEMRLVTMEQVERYADEELQFEGFHELCFEYANARIRVSVGVGRDEIFLAELRKTMTLKALVDECRAYYFNLAEKVGVGALET